jgi:hypothetical protein
MASLSTSVLSLLVYSTVFAMPMHAVAAGRLETLPVINHGPDSQTIEVGASAVFSVDTNEDSISTEDPGNSRSGDGERPIADRAGAIVKYQWMRNGVPMIGESDAVLVVKNASSACAGSYRCVLTNSAGSVTTEDAKLRVVEDSCPGHLSMMSCRTFSGVGEKRLIAGFVVGCPTMRGYMPVALRASGPRLAAMGIERALSDPALVLRDKGGVIAVNRGWGGDNLVAAAAEVANAAEWEDPSSRDSAIARTLPCGEYTADVFSDKGDTGISVAEVFDARPPSQCTRDSAHLVNFSIRSPVGLGPNVPLMQFAVGGTTSVTLLIRGMGPALSALGIADVLKTPSLLLYRINGDGSQTWLQSNTRWGGKRYLSEIADKVGAFPWKGALVADATVLVTLPPARYLLILGGDHGATGVAIMELYEVP